MNSPADRLKDLLHERNYPPEFTALSADASTREYFRISRGQGSAIACVYPEPFVAEEQSYLDVTSLFLAAGLPVAKVFEFDEALGVIVQEDLGDVVLRELLEKSSEEIARERIDEAIRLIVKIQSATQLAFDRDSIASRLKFDREKLGWELGFFKEHFFGTYLRSPLSERDSEALDNEFGRLSIELEGRATVLCHRDFHAANLMIDSENKMRIIDHQDARIGSPAYDLVSLLLDRIIELPSLASLDGRREFFLKEREKLGLETIDRDDFEYEFRLQTVQRCLKAAGTFSFQSVNRGKTYFVPFIQPMLRISVRAAASLGVYPEIVRILSPHI